MTPSGQDGGSAAGGNQDLEARDDDAEKRKRAHKARQRRRKNERRHAAVAGVLDKLQPPAEAAFTPLEKVPAWAWGRRGDDDDDDDDKDEHVPVIEWASMEPACDPAFMANDGDEAAMMRKMRDKKNRGGDDEVATRTTTTSSTITLRAWRKRWQVESFALVLRELETWRRTTNKTDGGGDANPNHPTSRQRTRVVDFGAGSGNLTLPLAKRFPDHDFVAVEMKQRSADLLMRRAAAAGLTNVVAHVGMIEKSGGAIDDDDASTRPPGLTAFDVGVALHACGNATDHAIQRCVDVSAAFVVSPCCIGKLKFSLTGGSSFSAVPNSDWTAHPSHASAASAAAASAAADADHDDGDVVPCQPVPVPVITHPRSRWLAAQLSGPADFAALAAAADTGHAAGDVATAGAVNDLGRRAKIQVELDRAQAAREAGYEVVTLSVVRASDAPPNKSHLLVGVPESQTRSLERLRKT